MSEVPLEQAEAKADAPPPKPGALKKTLLALGLIIAVLAGYLLLWPSPIDPVAYEPPVPMPLEGPLAPNDRLQSAELLAAGKLAGPEDLEVDEQGQIMTGLADGRVVRVETDGKIVTIANTGGRPVGIALDGAGNLIVADAVKGLLSISPDCNVTTLVAPGGELKLGFADDVTVARDGRIYFSDASDKFDHTKYLYDMLEARPHGRLLRYDPATRQTEVLLDGLFFANGVALSQNEDFLLVNETYRFHITRYWLSGERAGKSDVFLDHLPGYPDNINRAPDGTFWLALFTVRNPTADWLSSRPFTKSVMAKLPSFLWPQPEPYAFVVRLDEQGKVIDSFQDPSGKHLFAITSAVERDGKLYMGSLLNDRIGKFKLP